MLPGYIRWQYCRLVHIVHSTPPFSALKRRAEKYIARKITNFNPFLVFRFCWYSNNNISLKSKRKKRDHRMIRAGDFFADYYVSVWFFFLLYFFNHYFVAVTCIHIVYMKNRYSLTKCFQYPYCFDPNRIEIITDFWKINEFTKLKTM